MSREQQKQDRRNTILTVALDRFIRNGFGSTRISDIAQAADMSVGLMFHYFPSKEDLYHELVTLGSQGLTLEFPKTPTNYLDVFRSITSALLTQLANDPFQAQLFILMDQAQYLEHLPERTRQLLQSLDAFIERATNFIQEGQALTQIRPGSPRALAICFFSALQGLAQHIALDPDTPLPEADWLIAILAPTKGTPHET